jgi:hypothetical protein
VSGLIFVITALLCFAAFGTSVSVTLAVSAWRDPWANGFDKVAATTPLVCLMLVYLWMWAHA